MSDARQDEDAGILKEWYKKQPHLPQGIDDEYFLTFASGSKSLEIAKQKIDTFFSLRWDLLWFRDFGRFFEKFLNEEEGGDYFFLPGKTPEGWRVCVACLAGKDPDKLDPVMELFKRMMTIELALFLYPRDSEVAIVYDLKGLGAGYFARLDFPGEVSVLNYTTRALPRRMKKAFILNASPVTEKTVNLFRPFLSKKLNERVVVSPGDKVLQEYIPTKMLPEEYGGEAGTVSQLAGEWKKTMLEHENWFREKMNLRSDESKRPKTQAGSTIDNFGIQGSFRKLAID